MTLTPLIEKSVSGGSTNLRHEIGPVTILQTDGGSFVAVGQLRDRLGSPLAQTNASGVTETRGFDSFGAVTNGDFSPRVPSTLNLAPTTLRGFTGHEHVDSARVIHMNGRIYDPKLGRFYSVDPVIQFPSNSQSLNPYSYIMNNPLSGRDPSGYEICTGSHIDSGGACGGGEGGVSTTWVNPPSGMNAKSNGSERQGARLRSSKGADKIGAPSVAKDLVLPENGAAGFYRVNVNERSQEISSVNRINAGDMKDGDKVFVNGILQKFMQAIITGASHIFQIDSAYSSFVLAYNPTRGLLLDMVESGRDIFASTTGLGHTGMAKELANAMIGAQNSDKTLLVIGHSQGGAILTSALRYAKSEAGEDSLSNMRLAFHGAPVNNFLARGLADSVGIDRSNVAIRAQRADFVHYVLGLNSLNPLRIGASIIMTPALFMGPDKSQHTLPCGGPGAVCNP